LALPAETLLLDGGGFRLCAHQRRIAGAVGFAESMAASNERDRFLVVHRHAREGLADIARGGEGIWLAVRPFRIYVDQTHLHRAERLLKITVAAVALVCQPFAFRAPVDALVWLPDFQAPAAKTERFETHRLKRDVARENHEVGSGDIPAIFLLDRPSSRRALSRFALSGQLLRGREALLARSGAATAVTDAIRPSEVPRHPNEQTTVMAEVGRPLILRVGQQGMQILDYAI
jgi:hypothetical protein